MKKLFTIFALLVAMNASGQWQPDVRLTNNLATSEFPALAVSISALHVVWHDNRDGNYEIYYKRSTDAGVSWGTDTRLTNSTGSSQYPSVTVSGQFVHAVWMDVRDGNREIYYKRSSDGGSNWGADVRLTTNTSISQEPSVSASGTVVHVVWEDYRDGNYEIYYKRSTDGGVNWGADTRLTNSANYSSLSSINVSGTTVHIVWIDERDGNPEVYYKRSTDGGTSWGTDTRLTNNIYYSSLPSIAVSGANLHIAWEDKRDGGNPEIYYKSSTDGGINWGADMRLTNNPANSEFPSIAVIGSNVHIVWYDARDGNAEIYNKRSTDGGVNWETDTRLTNSIQYSAFPSVAISGLTVHVVWEDTRDADYEIYYKRNPTGIIQGVQDIGTKTPSAFSLEQNYPNPFNPITNVKFSIINSGNVKIIVYDIMGREVQTLVNEKLQPGTYEATFDGSMLPSGVYFYHLTSGDFKAVKKMILVK
jgi:hypothetical protein